MTLPTIRSRPVWTTLRPDPTGRHHLLVSQDAGGAAVMRLLAELPAGADVRILHAGAALPGCTADVRLFASEAELLAELDRALASCVMGTRLHVAGAESFLGLCVKLAMKHGLNRDAIQCEHQGSAARRVYCIHCRTFSENVTTNIVRCGGCGRHLFVRDHYSRRLAAFMGVMVDAEVPGELPPITETFA